MNNDVVIRLVVLGFALVNQFLCILGYDKLPWTEDEVGQLVSGGFTTIAAAWAYWKNNSHSPAAITSDKIMQLIKEGTATADEVEQIIRTLKGGSNLGSLSSAVEEELAKLRR